MTLRFRKNQILQRFSELQAIYRKYMGVEIYGNKEKKKW